MMEGGFVAAPVANSAVVHNRSRQPFPGQTMHTNQELAVSRGMSKLAAIADRMQLGTQIQEAGRRMYQLAVQMSFNSGRPTQLVATACLYIICRRTRSPHLLLDFADVLQKPVKVIGQTYMRLLRRLVGGDPRHSSESSLVEVPIIDPSIYIERFARKLNFGRMNQKVQNTALRLIQFMHRDWICIGRRPNGLCGAALLIASCYHGQRCTAKDISDVVRLRESTLRQRLLELRYTPLATLSRTQFEQGSIESTQPIGSSQPLAIMPPCMRESRKKEELAALLDKKLEEDRTMGRAVLDGKPLEAITDGKAGDSIAMPPPKGGPRNKRKGDSKLPGSDGDGGGDDGALVLLDRARAEKFTKSDPTDGDIQDTAREIAAELQITGILEEPGQAAPSASAAGAAARIGELDRGGKSTALVSSSAEVMPMLDGTSVLPEAAGDSPKPLTDGQADSGEEEGLSDIDDEELDAYLLDRAERQDKSDIWHEVNKDYLEEWHVRGRESKRQKQRSTSGSHHSQAASDAGDASASESGSNSRSSRKGSWRPRAASCTESAVMALAKKGKVGSNRINIEALESLFS